MLWGFFKKVVVADTVGVIVDAVYGNLHGSPGPMLVIAVLAFATQQIEFVVARHELCPPRFDESLHEADDAGTVGAAVAQVADEHESPVTMVPAFGVVAETSEQRAQRLELAMDVPDDIEGSIEERLDESAHDASSCSSAAQWRPCHQHQPKSGAPQNFPKDAPVHARLARRATASAASR